MNMESPTARERKLQCRRERERAHRTAETAAEKDESMRKITLREIRRGKLWRQTNREWQGYRENVLGRVKDFLAKTEEQQKVIKGRD